MKQVVVATVVAVTVALTSPLVAQSPAAPAFEVVSVKPSDHRGVGPGTATGNGRFTRADISLRQLIAIAYDLGDNRIDGGPQWQTTRHFDIQARTSEPVDGIEPLRPMLKSLLADRFRLKVHVETREMPIYLLVASRNDGQPGPAVTSSTIDCARAERDLAEASARDRDTVARLLAGEGVPCAIMPMPARAGAAGSMTMRARAASMAILAQMLTSFTGRMVRDRTGLTGRYDWELTFDRARRPIAQPPDGSPLSASPSDSPPLMTALQEQLGLTLESARGPVEMLVIDSAELPEAN
jgi:uncharacterized protein (TIGR03435 family)